MPKDISHFQNNKRLQHGIKPIIIVFMCLISFYTGSTLNGWWVTVYDLKNNQLVVPLSSSSQISTQESIFESHSLNRSKQKSKNLIQVGANYGIKGNIKIVSEILNDPDSNAILVEGSPQVFQKLTENVKAKYDKTQQRIVPFNAMICEDGEKKTFYYPNLGKLRARSKNENVQIPHWVEYQIGSLEESSVIKGISHYLRISKNNFPGDTSASDFILQKSVNCTSFASVIAQAPIKTNEVGVLAVDVDGYNAHVMLESFKVPELQPDVIVFEYKSCFQKNPKEFNTVMETLEKRGYTFDCERVKEDSDSWICRSDDQDVHAYKKK